MGEIQYNENRDIVYYREDDFSYKKEYDSKNRLIYKETSFNDNPFPDKEYFYHYDKENIVLCVAHRYLNDKLTIKNEWKKYDEQNRMIHFIQDDWYEEHINYDDDKQLVTYTNTLGVTWILPYKHALSSFIKSL